MDKGIFLLRRASVNANRNVSAVKYYSLLGPMTFQYKVFYNN